MFAELLPVQKVPNTPARSPGHNYTIYTPCGFCCPLENELMRESYWEGSWILRDKKPKKFRTRAVNCLRKSEILFSEDFVSGKVLDNYTKMAVLISLVAWFIWERARNARPHQKTISMMTTRGPKRRENCQIIFIHIQMHWMRLEKGWNNGMKYLRCFECKAYLNNQSDI